MYPPISPNINLKPIQVGNQTLKRERPSPVEMEEINQEIKGLSQKRMKYAEPATEPPVITTKTLEHLNEAQGRPFGFNFNQVNEDRGLTRAPAKSIYEILFDKIKKEATLEIYGNSVKLSCMGKGSLMHAYDLTADTQLVAGIDNSNILVKLYFIELKCSKAHVKSLPQLMQTSIASYQKGKELGIPQATLYNIDTAMKDGFFIVEKIPEELDMECPLQMAQVQILFQTYFKEKFVMDLAPDNLRVKTEKTEEGTKQTVVLVDYLEKEKKIKKVGDSDLFFMKIIERWYKTLCKKYLGLPDDQRKIKASELINFLTQGLEDHGLDPEWIKNAI